MAQVRHIDDTRSKRTTTQKRRRQAEQYAEHARAKAEERREQESGLSGLVSERAGEWSLDGPDWAFMERQKYVWNPLMDHFGSAGRRRRRWPRATAARRTRKRAR